MPLYADILMLEAHSMHIGEYLIPEIVRLVRTEVGHRRSDALSVIAEIVSWTCSENDFPLYKKTHMDLLQKCFDAGLLLVIDEIFLSQADDIHLLDRARMVLVRILEGVSETPEIIAVIGGQLGVILGRAGDAAVWGDEDTTRHIKELLAKMPSM